MKHENYAKYEVTGDAVWKHSFGSPQKDLVLVE